MNWNLERKNRTCCSHVVIYARKSQYLQEHVGHGPLVLEIPFKHRQSTIVKSKIRNPTMTRPFFFLFAIIPRIEQCWNNGMTKSLKVSQLIAQKHTQWKSVGVSFNRKVQFITKTWKVSQYFNSTLHDHIINRYSSRWRLFLFNNYYVFRNYYETSGLKKLIS